MIASQGCPGHAEHARPVWRSVPGDAKMARALVMMRMIEERILFQLTNTAIEMFLLQSYFEERAALVSPGLSSKHVAIMIITLQWILPFPFHHVTHIYYSPSAFQ